MAEHTAREKKEREGKKKKKNPRVFSPHESMTLTSVFEKRIFEKAGAGTSLRCKRLPLVFAIIFVNNARDC